eukprot:229429_1
MMTFSVSRNCQGFLRKCSIPIAVLFIGAAVVNLILLKTGNGISTPVSVGAPSISPTALSAPADLNVSGSVTTPMSGGATSNEPTSSASAGVNASKSTSDTASVVSTPNAPASSSLDDVKVADSTKKPVSSSTSPNRKSWSTASDRNVFVNWNYRTIYEDASKPTEEGQSVGFAEGQFVEVSRSQAVMRLFDLFKRYRSPGVN